MKESFIRYKDQLFDFWKSRTRGQKAIFIGGFVSFLLISIILTIIVSKTDYVPLYANLSPEETGQIKASLDNRGISSVISDNGTTISVPKEAVDHLKVELAAEGIPKSGNIDYSFFGENAGFGMTDKEFNVLEREAMQTELSNLIKSIDGIQDASVMINLPGESVWVAQEEQQASAAVVLTLSAGKDLDQSEVNALYNLVSKSVPNLPTENIVIMDQFFSYFDLNDETNANHYSMYEQQRQIKRDIERDIQRQVQQMLATMMGPEKVVTAVTADIDFTQENREENLVEPVDPENMEGLQVSAERIRETFSGDPDAAEGVAGIGENDIPNYPGMAGGGVGDYEREEERVNHEFNRVRREIVESPYKIQDLGIQVMVEPPEPDNPDSLPLQTIEDIEQILATIVQTSISKDADTELDPAAVADKIYVSAQPFNGKMELASDADAQIPAWLYVLLAILIMLILLLLYLFYRRRASEEEEEMEQEDHRETIDDIPELTVDHQSDEYRRKKQLERMASEKPEDFAKLLRTWLAED